MLIGINEMRRNGNPETKIMKMEIFFFFCTSLMETFCFQNYNSLMVMIH